MPQGPAFRFRLLLLSIAFTFVSRHPAEAGSKPARFKSTAGRFDVIFEAVSDETSHIYMEQANRPKGQNPQYVIYFYATGSSEPVSTDVYVDTKPARSPSALLRSMI